MSKRCGYEACQVIIEQVKGTKTKDYCCPYHGKAQRRLEEKRQKPNEKGHKGTDQASPNGKETTKGTSPDQPIDSQAVDSDLTACEHVKQAQGRAGGQKNEINIGSYMDASELSQCKGSVVNRVSLPGDPGYKGVAKW